MHPILLYVCSAVKDNLKPITRFFLLHAVINSVKINSIPGRMQVMALLIASQVYGGGGGFHCQINPIIHNTLTQYI